ncbi:MAG TPA: hypothetical protein VND40_06520 [Nitrososphaerales archaeon]|nr:hypothetical protein [Nitrososphaerales archaeon]
MSEDRLSTFLKTGSDWARMKTSVPGIFILKMPAYRTSPPRLAVELNPTDESGAPTKKRGLVLRSAAEFDEYKGLFQHERLSPLLKSVEGVNPPQAKKAAKSGEEVLQL